MKTLIVIVALIFTLSSSNARYDVETRIPFYIINAASEYGLDAELMYAICTVESKCKAHALNRNDGTSDEKAAGIRVKSYGLFQIKVTTAETLGFESKTYVTTIKKRGKKEISVTKTIDNSKELLKPSVNAYYAAKLLNKLYRKYRSTDKVLSAYNAGHYVKSNKDYVFKVLKVYAELKIDQRR